MNTLSTATAATAAAILLDVTYNFKFFPADTWIAKGAKLETVESWANRTTEAGVKTFQRPALPVKLAMPSFYHSLPDSTVQELVADAIYDFVKSEFIDKFLPVGNHDWATIVDSYQAKQSATGGGLFAWNEDKLKLVAESIAAWLEEQGKKALGAVIAKCVSIKFTKLDTKKLLGANYTKANLGKVQNAFGTFLDLMVAAEIEKNDLEAYQTLKRLEKNLTSILDSFNVVDAEMAAAFGE